MDLVVLNARQSDVSRFCINEAGYPNLGLCLCVKKRLLVYSWAPTTRTFQLDTVGQLPSWSSWSCPCEPYEGSPSVWCLGWQSSRC